MHSVCGTNSENMYWKEEKNKVQGYLNESFIKLGQKMSSPGGTSACTGDNIGSRGAQRQEETNADQLQVIHEFDTVAKISWKAHATCLQAKTFADVMRHTSHLADLIRSPGKDGFDFS
jgi:hypothetical protein